MSEGKRNSDGLNRLAEILDDTEKRISPMLFSHGISNQNEDGEGKDGTKLSGINKTQTTMELLDISKILFADIECLGIQYEKLQEMRNKSSLRGASEKKIDFTTKTKLSTMILSGLLELHVPPEVEPTDADLPETLFGQVDLQTTALAKLVKKFTRRLTRADNNMSCNNEIRILDIGVVDSDINSDDENDSKSSGNESENQKINEGNDDCQVLGSDEEERRMRIRMERAMDDADEESELSNSLGENCRNVGNDKFTDQKGDVELYDPVAEDLRDGFFDLVEMEDFADEEEDYLPNDTFGQTADDESSGAKILHKKSFHQRQREGLLSSDDSDNSDNEREVDEIFEKVKDTKRRKYREEEEIGALYDLYQESNLKESDNDDDAVHLSAADFFGQPKKKYIERYKKNRSHSKVANNTVTENVDGDDDSWGEYDFEKDDKEDWREGNNDSVGDDNGEDETVDMKGPSMNNIQGKNTEKVLQIADEMKKATNQEEKLRRQTEELEMELIDAKPWQMRGESKSSSRPTNSLLEGTPAFDMASKQTPVITVQHTVDLEAVIKKRILSEDWDDVVPRELPDIGWNKRRGEAPEVSQEKSMLGLGELYEREYLKKAVGFDKDAVEKQTEEDKAKDEMKQLFAHLCSKLDALSNYHFAPRPIADEVAARPVTVPAIAMEEVLPLHVSDARGIAPEEVFATKRGREGILRVDNELDQNERKKQRKSKKSARRKARKEKEEDEKLISRLQPGLGLNNPYEKRKARDEISRARAQGKVTMGEKEVDTKFGQSGTFFKRLQAEAQQIVHDHGSRTNDNDHEKKNRTRSSGFKL